MSGAIAFSPASAARSTEANLIAASAGQTPCAGVVNNGSTSDTTALQNCVDTGSRIVLPTENQGGGSYVKLSAALDLRVRGAGVSGGAWSNSAVAPTEIAQSTTNADGIAVMANRAGSLTLQGVDVSTLNIHTTGTASTGIGLHLTDQSGDTTGYDGDLFSASNLLIGNTSAAQSFSQCFKSWGYGNGWIKELECYTSTTTDSGLYGGEIGGTTANSWTILDWMGGCTANNAGAFSFDSGIGNFIRTKDTDYCNNVLNVGTNGSITAQVIWMAGDHESQKGTTATIQANSSLLAFDYGFGINVQNSTSPFYSMGGGSPLTLFTPVPMKSKLATNYPAFTVAPTTGTGTKSAGTYSYAVYGSNPSGVTITSPTQDCVLASTGKCTLTFTQLPGISNLNVCELSSGTLYTFTSQPVLEGDAATWIDDGSLSLSANVCPTTATAYYGLGNKTTYQDDPVVIGSHPVGSGVGIGNLWADQHGEWYDPYDHCPAVSSVPSTALYGNRLGCVKYVAPLSAAANDGLYYFYRNSAGTYSVTGNLFTALNATILLNDTTGTVQSIEQDGVGTSAPQVMLYAKNVGALEYPLLAVNLNPNGYVLRAFSGSTETFDIQGIANISRNAFYIVSPTAATNGTNQSSPLFQIYGNGFDGSVSRPAGFDIQTILTNTAVSPNMTLRVLPRTGGSLTPAYFMDLSPVTGGVTLPAVTKISGAVSVACLGTDSNTNIVTGSCLPSSAVSGMTTGQIPIAATASTITSSIAYGSTNVASTIVERDASGNFTAGTITAALTGTASGNQLPLNGNTTNLATGSLLDITATGTGAYGVINADGFFQTNLPNDGSTATVTNKTACENTSGNAQLCGANTKSPVVGACVGGCGSTGYPKIAVRGNVASLIFDSSSAVTMGDWVVTSATAGLVADTGSGTYPTCGNQVVGVATSSGLASTTQSVLLLPDALPACGTSGQVMQYISATSIGMAALSSSQITTALTYTPANCTAGTTGSDCLVLTGGLVPAANMQTQYTKGSCTEAWRGSGTSFALTSGDDAVVNNACYNDSGVTRTITAVKCRSSASSNTTTVNPTFGSAGTGTTILSGALTCGNSYAYSSTGTVSNASWTTGTGIDPAMAGSLTGTSIAMIVEYTY